MISFVQKNKGAFLIGVIIFSAIAISLFTAFISWTVTTSRMSRRAYLKEQAFQIAEAGTDYYRWHLAHNKTDFQDGTGVTGSYTHNFEDKDGNVIGQFILTITPPVTGSTVVKVRSVGKVTEDATISRTIETKLAIPSFAKWAVVANDEMRFGEGTEVFGPIHSNYGVRFDGLAHNLVTSAQTSYDDPDHTESPTKLEFGVHTHVKPSPLTGTYTTYVSAETPPSTVASRSDVFMAGRQFPVSQADFAGITANLSQMKTDAIASGRYFAASGYQGYHIVLKTNDTFDLYRVTSQTGLSNTCSQNSNGGDASWGSWSINPSNGETLLGNYAFPANGIIFTEDNVWVSGQINTARVTIAAGKFPDNVSTRKNITINSDLLYTNYDGQDILSLIAQNNINVGFSSGDTMRIDGALIAQNGRVGRYYYDSSCGTGYIRDTLTLYGMIGTNQRYGFAYTDGTGYQNRNLTYDGSLLYAPPPSFPLTSSSYSTISWQEIN